MSGTLRVVDATLPLRKHDHVDLLLDSGKALRFNDPRRFGTVLFQAGEEPHSCCSRWGRSRSARLSTVRAVCPFGAQGGGEELHHG